MSYHKPYELINLKRAINFTSEEARFILDEHGVPESVVVKESKESHQLIEELMLLANRTVAEYVSKQRYKGSTNAFPISHSRFAQS
ncbi:MAG: RNB domain-containing ribonuclease [Bacteroidetes bacterium]|nr:RNB domain-containing ribonuclease [Bacteroidota bacterium]